MRSSTGIRSFLQATAALALLCFASSGLAAPFRDAADRTVDIGAKVDRIIPAGPPAEVLIYALAPGKLAGLVETFPAEGLSFVPEAYRKLEPIPRLSRGPTPEDFEKLKQLKADLVIDYGNVGKGFVASIDKAQTELGVPAILVDGKLAATPKVLREVGALIGAAERGERLAALAEKVLEKLAPLAALPEDKRPSVYLARGNDGLLAVRPGGSVGEAVDAAGGHNVVASGSGAFVKMKVEEVVGLAPDIVIFENADALKSPLRAALPAKTRVYLDQPAPFGALESPPSVNRLIGALALAAILHPEKSADAAFLANVQETFFGPIPAGQKFVPLAAQ